MPQEKFLTQMGLTLRLEGLLREARTEEQQQEIRSVPAKVESATGMGKEYQVMGITSNPFIN